MSEKEIIDNWLNMEHQQPIQLATQDAYWQQVRIQASIEFAAQILGNLGGAPTSVAKDAVDYADALIAELQKEGGTE